MWRPLKNLLATLTSVSLLLIFCGVMVCLLNRWDSMVAITLIPIWTWAGFGMLTALISWLLFRGTLNIAVLCLWLISAILISEEPRSFVRELALSFKGDAPSENQSTIRIVNINANESEALLRRVIELKPDIVVIQKAPREKSLEAIAEDLYGLDKLLVINQSNAIIARGELINTLSETEDSTLHLRLKSPEGHVFDITNVDLDPYLPSPKLWRKKVWKRLTITRIKNRRLLRRYLGENQMTEGSISRIISGGFGTPPGDDVYRPLETAQLSDAFARAGTGWGNTYPGRYPLVRLDQVWVSPDITPLRVTSQPNPGSTHRIVIADLALKKSPK